MTCRPAIVFWTAVFLSSTAVASPQPLLAPGHSVSWWFAFKFNSTAYSACVTPSESQGACPFGGTVQKYAEGSGLKFVYASSESPHLKMSASCAGNGGSDDPIAATYTQVYGHSDVFYAAWNDQFDGSPILSRGAPYGHSKGLLAWDATGAGFVLQVSTPGWPAGNNGGTLGCIEGDDDVEFSQHFFSLALTHADLVQVLTALANASVVTDPTVATLVHNGGPADVQALVKGLGKQAKSTAVTSVKLSSGVMLLSKPSKLHVPPWQLVSSLLGGVDVEVATWWAHPIIPDTTSKTPLKCWDKSLRAPGAVTNSPAGHWESTSFSLKGGPAKNANHAKIGISGSEVIFGDENQQGSLSGSCASSQNGRGGVFYVLDNAVLAGDVGELLNAGVKK